MNSNALMTYDPEMWNSIVWISIEGCNNYPYMKIILTDGFKWTIKSVVRINHRD